MAGSDSAKRRVWRGILLRERADLSETSEQKIRCCRYRQTRFVLCRLFVFCRREWPVHDRRFHAAERRANYGGGEDRDWIILSDLLERRDRGLRFSSARTSPASHRRTSSRTVFQKSARTSQVKNHSCENREQRLDWYERSDFERRHHRGKLGRGGGVGRYKERGAEHGRRRKSGGRGETISSVRPFNVQRSTPNAQRSIQKIRRWALDVGRCAFSFS